MFKFSLNPDADGKQFARDGYVLIGTSSFLGNSANLLTYKAQATTQGMKVGAAVVLLHLDYTGFLGGAGGYEATVVASYWAHPVAQ